MIRQKEMDRHPGSQRNSMQDQQDRPEQLHPHRSLALVVDLPVGILAGHQRNAVKGRRVERHHRRDQQDQHDLVDRQRLKDRHDGSVNIPRRLKKSDKIKNFCG